jgi:hypothetical protein
MGSKEHGTRPDPRELTSELALLRDLWVGAKRPCIPATASQQIWSQTVGRHWRCEVPGWNSVVLTTGLDDNIARRLNADSDDSSRCEMKRFAQDAVVTDVMEGKVVREVTAALLSGPFAGACVTLGDWFDRPRCDVSIFSPKNPLLFRPPSNPELQRTGCARR